MPPSALESTAAATPRRAAIGDSGADTRAKVTRAAPSRNYMAGNEGDLPDGYIAPTADSSTACAQTRALPIFRDTNAAGRRPAHWAAEGGAHDELSAAEGRHLSEIHRGRQLRGD